MNKYAFIALFLFFCFSGFFLYQRQQKTERGRLLLAATQNPPSWMKEQIHLDLAPFKRQDLSEESLDATYKTLAATKQLAARVRIDKGVVSIVESTENHSRLKRVCSFLKELSETVSLPDVDFILYLEDGLASQITKGPVFTFAKRRSLDGILFPDSDAILGYDQLSFIRNGSKYRLFEISKILEASRASPWEVKTPLVFWRGAPNNPLRTQLVELSLLHPDLIDARFVGGRKGDPVREEMEKRGLISDLVKPAEQIRNRYLIDIDGGNCTYSRSVWILLSNSLLLKPSSENIQWYYRGLSPYEHYLPLQDDLSDLLAQQEWAEKHPERCIEMSSRATEFVEEGLLFNGVCLYTYLLFQEYALQQGR